VDCSYCTANAAGVDEDGELTCGSEACMPVVGPLPAVVEASDDTDDCTCYLTCDDDSHSGKWHQHEDEPCPAHPDAPVVG
jgi:hypothetical protein